MSPDAFGSQMDRLTAETTELLSTLIVNACVNDGSVASGQEVRNAATLRSFLEQGTDLDIETYEAAPGRVSLVSRIEGSNPDAPSLCLMGHTDVVPANPSGWSRDPFGGEVITSPDGVQEVWGRGAVDMLNITASMAVAFRALARSGFKPAGDLIYFAVADEESGSAYGARWMADHHPDAIRADYVLTENGGLHGGSPSAPTVSVNIGEKGVAWRRLRVSGRPGHGSTPFRGDNALVKAAGVIQRLTDYRPPARFTELWRPRIEGMGFDRDTIDLLMDPSAIEAVLDELPAKTAAYLYSCSHTTFSCNVIDGGEQMKTNVVPDSVMLDVDIRTLPGEGTEEVRAHLDAALGDLADKVEVEILMDDRATMSPAGTPLWDALQRGVADSFPQSTLTPQMVVGFTDARVFRDMGSVAYGAGLFSPNLDSGDFSSRFHGNDERVDVESLRLSTKLWLDVASDLLAP